MIALPRSTEPDVSLLIVTSGANASLEMCLRSIARHFPATIASETVIVMNAPTDAVRDLVRDGSEGATVVESPVNLGLAGGYNLAREHARGRLLLILHDDAELLPGSMEPLFAALEARPEAGAVGCRLLNEDRSHQLAGAILWKNALTSPWPYAEEPTAFPVDYVTLCGTLTHAAVWDAVGGQDERIYPAFYVDVNFSTSLWAAGRAVFCEPAARIIHRRGVSNRPDYRTYLAERNRPVFAQKWAEQLSRQEPFTPGDPGAIERAKLRTHERWAALATGDPAPLSMRPAERSDPEERAMRHLRMALREQSDWGRWLEAELAAARQVVEPVRAEAEYWKTAHQIAQSALEAKRAEVDREIAKKQALKEKAGALRAKIERLRQG